MPSAFLHKKSLLDQFKDDYAMTDPIKAHRAERSWGNPIIRHKREKGIQDWAKSFAGKRHYRKLMRFNAMRSEAFNAKEFNKFYDKVIDALLDIYDEDTIERIVDEYPFIERWDDSHYRTVGDVVADIKGWLEPPMGEAYKEKTAWAYLEELEKLEGEDSHIEATEKILKALDCKPGTEGRWYDKDGGEVDIIDVLDSTEWAFAQKVCGQLQEAKKSETLSYEKGHRNSRGEDAPWVIRDHKGGKVLASFAKKADAEAHLERMQRYSKNEAASHIVADNKLGKITKARLRDNTLAFYPLDDDGKNDDCIYFFKLDGSDIVTKGYQWDRDKIDYSMIAEDGYPWTAEPGRPTRDYVHTKEYAEYLLDRVRRCLDLGVATQESESLKKKLHESRAKKLERMGDKES